MNSSLKYDDVPMSDTQPTLSLRYFLTLEESQDGFALATFGKKQITRFITPLISIAIVIWGFCLGLDGVGRYYVGLGIFFLVLQVGMRYWFLPMMFKRQFTKYQLGKSEQGIDLFQDHAQVHTHGRTKIFNYHEVKNFTIGKLTYMIELESKMVIIVPKRAFNDLTEQSLFENTLKNH